MALRSTESAAAKAAQGDHLPGLRTCDDVEERRKIAEFYACFNDRRLPDAAAMFADDALVEHAALQRPRQGGGGYLEFADMWTRGFPDAAVRIQHISSRTAGLYEVELLAHGTHLGPLDFGGGVLFKPTGAAASLRLRQLLQFDGQKIAYSSLSFDLQDIVQQLVTVDEARLIECTRKIHRLGEQLASAGTLVERRTALQRLGSELDGARHVLRPYYRRSRETVE